MAKADTRIVRDERANLDSLAIVEKYGDFLNYTYPKVQHCERKDGVLRDQVLRDLLEPIPALYAAGKSGQISRLYLLDAMLATNRFWLRFLSHPERKVLSTGQAATSLARLDEVGRMLGTWMRKLKSSGAPDTARPMGEAG